MDRLTILQRGLEKIHPHSREQQRTSGQVQKKKWRIGRELCLLFLILPIRYSLNILQFLVSHLKWELRLPTHHHQYSPLLTTSTHHFPPSLTTTTRHNSPLLTTTTNHHSPPPPPTPSTLTTTTTHDYSWLLTNTTINLRGLGWG